MVRCYAELGAHHVGSGGEYHFHLTIHPYAGSYRALFPQRWVCSANCTGCPTFGVYLATVVTGSAAKSDGDLINTAMVAIHTRTYRESFEGKEATLLKLALIVVFIGTAWVAGSEYSQQLPLSSLMQRARSRQVPVLAHYLCDLRLLRVERGYYILGEPEEPQRDLPRALVIGCVVVTLIYVLLNTVFLTSAPTAELSGEVEIAYIVADEVLGPEGAFVVSLLLSGILISTVSAMVMAGPRALQRLGEDYVGLSWLGSTNSHGLPRNAIVVMGVVALLFLWTSTFEQILLFAGNGDQYPLYGNGGLRQPRGASAAQQSFLPFRFTPCPPLFFWLSRVGPCSTRRFSTFCSLP